MGQLCIQAHLRAGAFTLHKVWGERNPADLCTKRLVLLVMDRFLALMTGAIRESGRAATAPLATAEVGRIPCRGLQQSVSFSTLHERPLMVLCKRNRVDKQQASRVFSR